MRRGLLHELCTLVSLNHPLSRTRTYKTLAAAGLIRALSLALGAECAKGAGGSGSGSSGYGTGRDNAVLFQVRALDVLLSVLNHDPSLVRRA